MALTLGDETTREVTGAALVAPGGSSEPQNRRDRPTAVQRLLPRSLAVAVPEPLHRVDSKDNSGSNKEEEDYSDGGHGGG